VRRAMKMALDAAHQRDGEIYTYGPLIHNQQAIDLLRSRQIEIIQDSTRAGSGLIIIRAHGVTPEIRAALIQAGARICDATCPHVARAQNLIQKFTTQGYHGIIIGDKGHAEVVGLLGYAQGNASVVETIEDVRALPSSDKVFVVAQTTQSEELFREVSQAIEARYPDAKIFNTICRATEMRQEEAIELARQVDLMVVVGGRESANTRRLVELCTGQGTPTVHIETADELQADTLERYATIGVTAGASTPHWVIRNVVEALEALQRRRKPLVSRLVHHLFTLLIYSQLFLALGAAALTFAASRLMGIEPKFYNSLLAFFYVLAMHVLNKQLSLPKDRSLCYGALKFFSRYQPILMSMGVGGLCFSLLLSSTLSTSVLVLMLISIGLGIIYSLAIVPHGWLAGLRYRRLMDIPGSKDLFMAAAWAVVVVLVPFIKEGPLVWPPMFFTAAFVFLLVLMRSIVFDNRDIEGDITLGKETLPIVLGARRTMILLQVFIAVLFLSVRFTFSWWLFLQL
jgi:(E)-4-hydroxy-3-methyl-but-2-enyl pyrophosphate reductase